MTTKRKTVDVSVATPITNGYVPIYNSSTDLFEPGVTGGSPAGATGELQINNGLGSLGAASNVIGGASYLSIGATPATTGSIRLPNTKNITVRDAANANDITIAELTAANSLWLGIDSGATSAKTANHIYMYAQNNIYLGSNGGQKLTVGSSTIKIVNPIIGDGTAFGLHGIATQAMADANQTVSAAAYAYGSIKTTGALTANRNLILPAVSDVSGYTKIINNTCTGSFSIIVGDGGAGTTVSVANGTTVTILFDSRGATQVGVATAAGGFTAPTGSGLVSVTSGVLDSASRPVGTGVLTFLATPSSANLAAAITDETGTGALVFGTSPNFTTSLSVGSTPATTGDIRLNNTFNISRRNGANNGNETLFESTANTLSIAGPASGTTGQYFSNLVLNAFSSVTAAINGTSKMSIDSTGVSMAGATITGSTIQMNAGTSITFGGAPAAAGSLRLSNAGTIVAFRNSGNTGDLVAMASNVGNLYIGEDNVGANQVANLALAATGNVQTVIGSNVLLNISASTILMGHQTNTSSNELYANNVGLWGTTSAYIYNTSGAGYAIRVLSSKIEIGQPLALGTTPATTGVVRYANATGAYSRNAANSADFALFETDSSNQLFVGSSSAFASQASVIRVSSVSGGVLGTGGSNSLEWGSASVITDVPLLTGSYIQGNASPYGVHGNIGIRPPSDANYTLTSTEYNYSWIEADLTNWTTNRRFVFPVAAANHGYWKTINNTSGSKSVIVAVDTTGVLLSVSVAPTQAQLVWIDSTGVRKGGTPFTP